MLRVTVALHRFCLFVTHTVVEGIGAYKYIFKTRFILFSTAVQRKTSFAYACFRSN